MNQQGKKNARKQNSSLCADWDENTKKGLQVVPIDAPLNL